MLTGDNVVAEQFATVRHKNSVCNVGLSNFDIGNIVNDFSGEPLEMRPFDFVFQKLKLSRI